MKYNIVSFWNEGATPEEKEKQILFTARTKNDGDVRKALLQWAADSNCNQQALCADLLARADAEAKRRADMSREEIENNPFNPRAEVSADARHIADHIVKHLWIIFVLLPVMLGILFAILKAL